MALLETDIRILKDAERILRIVMILTLAIAGISKIFSDGGFYSYYSALFAQEELRINLPMDLVNFHLSLTPFLEIGISMALAITPIRRYAIIAWCVWFMTIQFGHYVLQEWSTVNEILPYQILGVLCYVLPTYQGWFRRR